MKTLLRFVTILLFTALSIHNSLAQNPTLFGMANGGGTHDYGTLFEYDFTGGQFTKIRDFDGINDGAWPIGSMMLASNGKMFGMINSGGANDWGVIFEFDPVTKTYTKKIDFDSINGRWPWGAFSEAPNGKLYGLTSSGGTSGYRGTLIEYDPALNTITTKKNLDIGGGIGTTPGRNNLTLAPNGKFYGTTQHGGNGGRGVLFEFDYMTSTYTPKVQMADINANNPYASMTLADNGKMYGTSNWGGAYGYGTIFEYDPGSDTAIIVVDLDSINLGSWPTAGFTKGSNGKLYAMINSGGTDDAGVILEFDPATGTATKKVDLDYNNDGAWAWGELTEVSPGLFYGMLNGGGANDDGTIIEYNLANNSVTNKMDFDFSTSGQWPNGNLVLYNGPVGITQSEEIPDISLHPNPADNYLAIDLGKSFDKTFIQVLDVQGRVVLEKSFTHGQYLDLKIAELPSGKYLVQINLPEYQRVLKFSKQ